MASSRDDFIIAIRSAFLKKETQQKFSLLSLLFISILIIILSSFNFKIVNNLRNTINEIVYRSSFVVSIPENLIINSYKTITEYSNFYDEYKLNKKKLENLKSKEVLNEIIVSENKELKNLIEDFTLTTSKILAKVIVDHDSPFLKTIIINKGSAEGLKIGTNIFDKNYLIGRVIETNFKTSRVLLLSDLNSSVPISITPGNIQAIVIGDGKNSGEIKYIKGNLIEEIQDQSIGYTSGTGDLFRSGVPVGRLTVNNESVYLNFYSDFSQLKYVFAEIEKKNVNQKNLSSQVDELTSSNQNTEAIKLKLLNDQIKILNETNSKFIEENKNLVSETENLNSININLKQIIKKQIDEINQNKTDQKELEFLRLNLLYSSKCQKSAFKKGYKIGTSEYRKCILNRGDY
ncbi:rod shape-determining protein MreC [Pelagibacterales bacterium SAG-MED09]|nr:rod shape-determining protein MreC [Pelagibacterales bacterium SAG-MED09]